MRTEPAKHTLTHKHTHNELRRTVRVECGKGKALRAVGAAKRAMGRAAAKVAFAMATPTVCTIHESATSWIRKSGARGTAVEAQRSPVYVSVVVVYMCGGGGHQL